MKYVIYFIFYFLKMWLLEHFNIIHVWKSLSHVQLFATPWTVQSMEFSRPEYWSGVLQKVFPSLGDPPNAGVKHRSPALHVDSLPAEPPGKPLLLCMWLSLYFCIAALVQCYVLI